MKNHDYAESARACVRKYVEQNEQLIRSWLEGSGTVEDVGAELILSEVERYNLNGKPDLRDRNDLFRVMDDALDSGSAVLCAALKSDFDDDISEISAGGHAYTVLDVDRENDVITVRNPWGHGERADLDGVNDGVFQLSGDQFFANYSYLYLDQDQSVA